MNTQSGVIKLDSSASNARWQFVFRQTNWANSMQLKLTEISQIVQWYLVPLSNGWNMLCLTIQYIAMLRHGSIQLYKEVKLSEQQLITSCQKETALHCCFYWAYQNRAYFGFTFTGPKWQLSQKSNMHDLVFRQKWSNYLGEMIYVYF